MCNLALVGLGIGAAGTFANVMSAKSQSNAYAQYQVNQTQSALSNYIQQSKQINLRYTQEQEANAEEREQIRLENMKNKATAQASAASSGIEGISIDNLFAGYDRATAVSNYTHARNLQMLGLEYNNQLDTYRMQALNTIYSMQPYTGARPATTLLSGIGGLMTTWSDTKLRERQLDYYKGKN